MKLKRTKIVILTALIFGAVIIGVMAFIAYARTWGKTELEFSIHINENLIMQSVYGEPPTFAIWIEDPSSGANQTIFVTSRAGLGDWEGKAEVPVALPKWDEINRVEKQAQGQQQNPEVDAVTGATPKPGYFTTRVRVKPGSKWICWIEVNLSGDYNEHYKEYDSVNKTTDEYGTGQPALVYKAEIEAVEGNTVIPEVAGMSLLNAENGKIIQPVAGITTALEVFDQRSVTAVRPQPKIVGRR